MFDAVSAFELVEKLQERYKFRQVPSAQEIAAGTAANSTFVAGKLPRDDGKEILIETFSVTYFGTIATLVTAVTRTSTDDSDFFLDHLANWAAESYQFDVTPTVPTNYHSQLEVILDNSLNRRFQGLEQFGGVISNYLRRYGFHRYPDFEPTGFSMHFDGTEPERYASAFSLERRVGAPFEQNRYFAQAPLKTADHERVLSLIDDWL